MIKTNPTTGNSSSSPPSSLARSSLRRRRQSKGLIADNRSPSNNKSSPPVAVRPQNRSTSDVTKPCHSARLAAACVNNALSLGAVTQFALCPNKARKTLLLRSKAARHRRVNNVSSSVSVSRNEALEEAFLANPPSTNIDLDDYSSGDEDEYDVDTPHSISKEEPYYIPTTPDAASMGLQGQPSTGGKLPFNYRKFKYFDDVTADDRGKARAFLRQELADVKKLRIKALGEKIKSQNNDNTPDILQQEAQALSTSMDRYPHEMTPTASAALLIESLALNPNESIEGMAKCYDGIVSAGTALLDIQNETKKLTTKEIVAALEPLLITTLEEPSGDVILALGTLKKYCATKRYQRRFVQRLAPFLVRPPEASIWCLRHQNDMEPIVAAVEIILDHCGQIFSAGWYERGKNLLKDTQRVEKLRSAASQLRRSMNCPSPVDGLLSVGSVHRRGSSIGGNLKVQENIAEWEMVSIDKLVRQSVGDVFSKDWSKISALNLSPTESDAVAYGARRRSFSSKDSGVTAANNSALTKSPRAKIPLSPRSGVAAAAAGQTPTMGGGTGQVVPSADALESTFGPSFSSQDIDENYAGDRPLSPPAHNYSSAAPLSPTRTTDSSKLSHPKTPPHDSHLDHPSSPGAYRSGLAPLSPQSSVGNASNSSGALSLRSVSGPAGSRDQYRALTSTAAERKRTVAACRALRAQITKFEESFIQMHGRAPKGTAERAPLASTYMQYREWKRAIRADAACRIQALCRGALVRSGMLRSQDPRVSRIVALRRARVERLEQNRQSNHLSHLSIPLDIGGSDQADSSFADHGVNRGTDSKSRLEVRASSRDDDGVEMVMKPNATTAGGISPTAASTGWKSRQQTLNQTAHSSPGSHSHRPVPTKSHSSLPDVTVMSLPELQQRKRELKQQLKMYDLNFHAQHGRMPEKREKEPIRHLYESYNAYKNQITVIEKGEAQPGPGTAAFRQRDAVTPSSSIADSMSDRLSPSSSQTPAIKSPSSEKSSSPKNSPDFTTNNNEATKEEPITSQDLASLKAEKGTLHQMLRSYEKEFFKQHKRQVSSFSDIRPVAGQYRRYKEIKKAIALLQDK